MALTNVNGFFQFKFKGRKKNLWQKSATTKIWHKSFDSPDPSINTERFDTLEHIPALLWLCKNLFLFRNWHYHKNIHSTTRRRQHHRWDRGRGIHTASAGLSHTCHSTASRLDLGICLSNRNVCGLTKVEKQHLRFTKASLAITNFLNQS